MRKESEEGTAKARVKRRSMWQIEHPHTQPCLQTEERQGRRGGLVAYVTAVQKYKEKKTNKKGVVAACSDAWKRY